MQADTASDDGGAETADEDGWPVLPELDLDVCVSRYRGVRSSRSDSEDA